VKNALLVPLVEGQAPRLSTPSSRTRRPRPSDPQSVWRIRNRRGARTSRPHTVRPQSTAASTASARDMGVLRFAQDDGGGRYPLKTRTIPFLCLLLRW